MGNDSTTTSGTSASPADLRLIRSEVNFLTYPFFCLDNRWHTDRLKIEYHRTLDRGEGRQEISWRVLAHQEYGLPGPFDWELHKAIEAIINERGFPVRNPIPFSMRDVCRRMGVTYSGRTAEAIKAACLRITSTMVESKRTFYSKPKKRWLEDNFHLYDRVVYRGDELPESTVPADTNYLFLGSWYLENLNALYVSLLDPHYRRSLSVSLARRLYEILGVKFYGLRAPQAPGLRYAYSTVCALLPVTRHRYLSQAHRQLDPAHQELIATGFLERVAWQPVADSPPDWHLLYVPGPHALQPASALPPGVGEDMVLDLQEPGGAAHVALSSRPGQRRARPAAGTQRAEPEAVAAPPGPAADDALTTEAHVLVQDFHVRFHGPADVVPSTKELTQARTLIARHGLEQARYLVDFSVTAAQETDYRPQTFGGILQYAARARADYAQAQERTAAEERAREERRRAQADALLRRQYEDERATRLTQLRATTPPDVLAAIEQAAAAHFDRAQTPPFGRDLLRRYALDDAVAAYFQLPSFAEWHATQDPQEGNGDATPYERADAAAYGPARA